jgi:type 1 fimbria pilin
LFVAVIFSSFFYQPSDLWHSEHIGVAWSGQAFHSKATTNSPSAVYVVNLDSHENFPNSTAPPAITPSTNGPYPLHLLARYASAAAARNRNAAVSGKR